MIYQCPICRKNLQQSSKMKFNFICYEHCFLTFNQNNITEYLISNEKYEIWGNPNSMYNYTSLYDMSKNLVAEIIKVPYIPISSQEELEQIIPRLLRLQIFS